MSNEIIKFNYDSNHNNFPAIESLNPIDIGTERQFRFTAKMLADMFNVAKNTIKNRIELLENAGDLSDQNFDHSNVPDSRGVPNDTVIYDLTVLNKLAMTMIDNPIAVNVRKAFNDVIVKVETTGQYNAQPVVPQTYLEALKALVASEEEKEQLKLANETLTQERDKAIKTATEAIATKAYINDKRTASLMGKVSGQSKKITRLEGELTTANDNINNLQNELDRTLSNMYTTKQVCEIIRRKFTIKLADSTLNQRVGKALRLISNELNERVVPQYTVVGEVTRTRYFYTDLTAETLIERLENDNNYLKSVK